MADTVMTVRLVVKEIAQRRGVYATSCRSRSPAFRARGCTPTLALRRRHQRLPRRRRRTASRRWPALHRRPAAPRPRDHRRHQPVGQLLQAADHRLRGPVYVSWARNNRSALVRVPTKAARRVDPHRVPGPRPGLQPVPGLRGHPGRRPEGIEEGYELPAEAAANLYELTPEELPAEGIDRCPAVLAEAVDVMERSELMAETLGEHVFEWFIRNKRAEWADYKAEVSRSSSTATCRCSSRTTSTDGSRSSCFPDPPPGRLGPGARPGRLPVEGGRPRPDARQTRRARRRLVRRRRLRRRRPRGRLRPVPGAAQRDLPLEPLLLVVGAAPARRARAARGPLRRLLRRCPFQPRGARGAAAPTCSGGRDGAPGRSWSSTGPWSSTSRPTRRPSAARRSTSRTWSTSC